MELCINPLVHLPLNKVVECKNRHLLEVTRTILIHMWVPKQFWDVILTTCYLINRMPSSVLDGQISYSVLYPQTNLFSLPPKVFGSVCFVYNNDPHIIKLDPRALKSVVLGYSRIQKECVLLSKSKLFYNLC